MLHAAFYVDYSKAKLEHNNIMHDKRTKQFLFAVASKRDMRSIILIN